MYKPALRSHTHLQAAQSDTQAKACKRVCLPNRTDTATMDRQTTTEKEGRTHNSGLAKVAVQCFVGQFCGYINFSASYEVCAENRHLRQAANRYLQV